jgi:hypothetical protein
MCTVDWFVNHRFIFATHEKNKNSIEQKKQLESTGSLLQTEVHASIPVCNKNSITHPRSRVREVKGFCMSDDEDDLLNGY